MSVPIRPLTPTAIASAAECLHCWHLKCFGDPDEKRPPDAGTRLRWDEGNEYEEKVRRELPEAVEVEWDGKDWDAGLERTVSVMSDGPEWIYQSVLTMESMRGKPDFLHRVDGESALGKFTFVPVDVKNHKSVIKKDRFQLMSYAALLEPVLGYRPEKGGIWLNTGEIEEVDLLKKRDEFDELVAKMHGVGSKQMETCGLRCGGCDQCEWIDFCWKGWDQTHSVCLVNSVTSGTARKLHDDGVCTFDNLAALDIGELMEKFGWKEDTARERLLYAEARVCGGPVPKKPVQFPSGIPIYFYDIETFGDCTYLHGVIRMEGNKRDERYFIAKSPEDEETAWHEFLDHLAADSEAVVYTWTLYERKPANTLWAKYGGNKDGWRVLDEGMEDMKEFVKQHFALPVTTYGIKNVAPCFDFHWHAEDAGGLNSIMWYREWLDEGDKDLLAKIIEYNLDDVRAMEVIYHALEHF